jgi:hypothetical protein
VPKRFGPGCLDVNFSDSNPEADAEDVEDFFINIADSDPAATAAIPDLEVEGAVILFDEVQASLTTRDVPTDNLDFGGGNTVRK